MRASIRTQEGRHRLSFTLESIREFSHSLGELTREWKEEGLLSEFRMEAVATSGENWVIYWKLKEGETRLLLAHPEPEQWVATCLLSTRASQTLIDCLENLGQAEVLSFRDPRLTQVGPLAKTSNFELEIERIA